MSKPNAFLRLALLWGGVAALSAAILAGVARSTDKEEDPSDLLKACASITVVGGSGSGFFLQRNGEIVVVTCRHVVNEQPVVEVRDVNGRMYETAGIRVASDRDLAVISLSTNSVRPLLSLEIIDGLESMRLGSELLCLGDSQGTGVIAPCAGKLLGVGSKAVEVDTPYVPGDSGAPIVLKGGRGVVGMASIRIRPREKDESVKGTRFANKARQIAVRLDNLDWDALKPFDAGTVKCDDTKRIFELAEQARDDRNESLEKGYYMYLAKKMDVQSMDRLRDMLAENKKGLNASAVADIFQDAANESLPSGLSNYGLCLLRGLGVRKNVHKGLEYIKRADALGDPYGGYMLGVCYQEGTGLERDLDSARKNYERAADKGVKPAMARLGRMYWKGEGVQKDLEKALKWCEQAGATNEVKEISQEMDKSDS